MCDTSTYVLVLYDFEYEAADGKKVGMKEGEEFLLLNKTNNDWWQVLRDGDHKPFYAPASYMEELSFEQKQNASNQKHALKDSIYVMDVDGPENNNNENKTSTQSKSFEKLNRLNSESKNYHGLLFNNPLYSVEESEADCSPVEPDVDYSDEDGKQVAGNAHDDKEQNSVVVAAVTTCEVVERKSPAKVEENLQTRASVSPIYANLPLNSLTNPPSPTAKETPTRILLHHWAEYEDHNGRKYYYNRITREKSWKPPRRRSEKFMSSSSHSSDRSLSQTEDAESNTVSPSVNSAQEATTMPIPSGWTQDVDKETEEVCYINDITKEKWFTSTDEQGRLYYYQENASESFWQLPEVIITEGEKQDNEAKSAVSTGEKWNSSPRTSPAISPKMRRPAVSRPASLADRGLKARSMILPDSRCSSLPRNSSVQLFNLIPPLQICRQGMLNKTKFMEGGKRLRKNWCASFIILSDVLLLMYKDMKSAQLTSSSSTKPEICIDLAGALIEWTTERSSRKNVFQISTVLGLQVLIQDDNYQTSKEWYESIRSAIAKLPSGITSSLTNPSIAQDSSMASPEENKKSFRLTRKFKSSGSQEDLGSTPAERKVRIRDKLINFFLRRPSIDILRERGILKEEPVFGCNLHNLCTREKTTVPRFIQKCIKLIEEKDMKADGLYRASGNLSQVQKIRFQVNQDNWTCLELEDDVHVLTGALKMFFRELKEPMIPFNTFEKFLTSIMNPDKAAKHQAFTELVSNLPRPNFDTLKLLFQHLLRVTEYSEFNRMHIQNLAIVFGPTLMWPETESKNLALDMIQQNQIIEYLLLEFDTLFS